jgi:alkylhydroperoxidase/carboxymuconolactone decarboxylase family protein YurZ
LKYHHLYDKYVIKETFRKELIMTKKTLPEQYLRIKKRHKKFFNAVESLGRTIKKEGPIKEKHAQLIQLAAAAAIRSEGAVHSHARRALQAGATKKEIYHAIILLTTTIGFPTVSAALSWVNDVIGKN